MTARVFNGQRLVVHPSGMTLRATESQDDLIVFELTIPARVLDDTNWDLSSGVIPMVRDLKPRPDGDAMRAEDL